MGRVVGSPQPPRWNPYPARLASRHLSHPLSGRNSQITGLLARFLFLARVAFAVLDSGAVRLAGAVTADELADYFSAIWDSPEPW